MSRAPSGTACRNAAIDGCAIIVHVHQDFYSSGYTLLRCPTPNENLPPPATVDPSRTAVKRLNTSARSCCPNGVRPLGVCDS